MANEQYLTDEEKAFWKEWATQGWAITAGAALKLLRELEDKKADGTPE